MGYGSRIASTPVAIARIDTGSVNITTAAYSVLIADLGAESIMAHIYNGSTSSMKLAIGPSGGEVDLLYISPGENIHVPLHVSVHTRITVKAVSGTASSGELLLTLFG